MFIKNVRYIVVLLILYVLWAITLPLLFQFNVENILNFVEKTSKYKIELNNPKLNLWNPLRIGFKAEKFAIKNNDLSDVLSVENPKLRIKFLPLFVGKCSISSFESNNIRTYLVFDKQLYIGNYPINLNDYHSNVFNINRLKIGKYEIKLFDKKSNSLLQFVGDEVFYKQTINYIASRASNKIYIKDAISDINFDLKIPKREFLNHSKVNLYVRNFNLSPFKNILDSIVSDKILALNGLINIDCKNSCLNGEIDNLKLIMNDGAKSIIFPEKLIINSNFALYLNKIKIHSFDAKGPNVVLNLEGSLENLFSKTPYFNLNLDMPKSDVRTIALMLPPVVVPQFNVYRLKMYPFYGISEAKLHIKGKLPEPNIDGSVNISEAYLIKPIPNAKKANINIKCVDKKMDIDVVVPAGGNEFVYVEGTIENYGDNKADLRIRSSKSVDLETAQFVLNPLHQILRFFLGPVPIMDITGKGNINIHVIGSKKDPHIWGDLSFVDTNASFNDIKHLVLENASGKLTFWDRDAHFINETGTINNQKIVIAGKCNLFGNIDFNIIGENQPLNNLLNTFKDSPMLESINSMLPVLKQPKGVVDLKIKLTGKVPNIYKIKFNDNIFAEGSIVLKDNSFVLDRLLIKKISGLIGFKNLDINLDLNSSFGNNSKINIIGHVKDGIANVEAVSSKFNVKEVINDIFKEFDDCFMTFNAKYIGQIDNIEYDKLIFAGKILKNETPIQNIKLLSGDVEIKNSKLKISNIYGFIKHNPFNIDLVVDNFSNTLKNSKISGKVNINNFDLKTLNSFKNISFIPIEIRKELQKFEILYGYSDINVSVNNNKINGYANLNNIGSVYSFKKTPQSKLLYVPIKLINGQIVIKNNRIFLNKMNYLVDNMPVLIYGNINDVFTKSKLNIHINSKLVQRTFDKYWNIDNIYPIKLKGDILLGSLISGTLDNINTKLDLKLQENSSIYYMGATIGDKQNPITINSDFDILKNNIIRLNKFQYCKLISSQNNKQNIFPLLTVKGGITYYDKFYKFDNLIIKTDVPTDARIFNVLFRKPTIKQGQFTSNLKINGKSNSPKILGVIDISGLDMPFLNTTIKDLSFNFKDKDVLVSSKGEILSNNIIFNARLKNKFSNNYHIEKADIALKELNVNNLMDELKQLELKVFNDGQALGVATSSNSLSSIIIDTLNVNADNIIIKNINAQNLKASCALDDKMQFLIKDFKFNLADGNVNGNAKYNLVNNLLNLHINANSVNANDLMTALLDLPNQIYGNLIGRIDLSTNLTDEKTSKETLSGKILFSVRDGRMPKLGSLEYLLRAGNVIKSGITGITMNSIIDLITPLKTGEFSSINGDININNGVAHKVEIHSEGKALNLFIKGQYNHITEYADMIVLGQLSRKVSTVFGAVGNISLNSLFNRIPGVNLNENGQLVNELNKIPGIELSNKAYRKFMVEISGNIDDENNVKSFRWIN